MKTSAEGPTHWRLPSWENKTPGQRAIVGQEVARVGYWKDQLLKQQEQG